MVRSLVANRIPRISIANRGIATRPIDATAPSGLRIGDTQITLTPPVVSRQTWQDLTVAVPPFLIADFPAFTAVQGPLNGSVTSNPQLANAANYQQWYSVAWRGAVYGLQAAGSGQVRKKTSAFGAYTNVFAHSGGTLNNIFTFASPLGRDASPRFVLSGQDGGGQGVVHMQTDDTTASPQVTLGTDIATNAFITHNGFDTGLANTFILIAVNPGPIFRTVNNGVSYTQIEGPLSVPAGRVWCGIWRNAATGNIHMIGQAMAIATSTDQGVTWTVNAAVPGALNISVLAPYGSSGQNIAPCVAYDWQRRKGYAVTDTAKLLSWDLDNPTAGFTTVVASGMPAGCFAYTSSAMFVGNNYNIPPKPGIWFATFADPVTWKQLFPLASIPTLTPPNPLVPTNVTLAIEQFGVLIFDNIGPVGAGGPANWTTPDLVITSDRWTVPDPGLLGGRKPYIRVL